jgi:hypothetical protein
MKGRENSMPLKNKRNPRWVKFNRKWLFVLWRLFVSVEEEEIGVACVGFEGDLVSGFVAPFVAVGAPANFASATLLGNVSGRQKYRYKVSTTTKNSEKPAVVPNGFAATISIVLNHAPSAGPNVNAMLKQIPTNAIVEPR